MLHNPIPVDMKVYTSQIKQKSTAGILHRALRNFRIAAFDNNFGGLSLKKTKEEKGGQLHEWFTFSRVVIYYVMKQSSSSTNFRIAQRFNLDYAVHFYKPKKELSIPFFTINISVADVFYCY